MEGVIGVIIYPDGNVQNITDILIKNINGNVSQVGTGTVNRVVVLQPATS